MFGWCLLFSVTEVHGDKLSMLSPDGQPLVIPYKHSVKQVMPVSLSCQCHVQAVFVEDRLKLVQCLLHRPVVHAVSA